MKKNEEQRIKNKDFLDAWANGFNGIIYAATTQKNIKIQLLIAVFFMILSLFFDLERAEFLCLVISIVFIVLAELINTAIETVVDLCTETFHPKAKIAKDVGAGAVILAALNAVVVGYFLFFEKISTIGTTMLNNIRTTPSHLVFVSIVLVVISVVFLKALGTTGKNKIINKNFIPSGQSALSFAILTAVWLNTKNIIVLILALILSIMVLENRLESKAKTMAEVVFGASIGALVVLLIYGIAFVM